VIVQLTGLGFDNKGAELMLRAIRQEIGRWGGVRAIVGDLRMGTPAERRRAELKHLLWADMARVPAVDVATRWLSSVVPYSILHRLELYRDRDVDIVLDASGYALWGEGRRIRRTAALTARWHGEGKSVILLPQALGPFDSRGSRSLFRAIAANVDLIFARDRESYAHAAQLGDTDKLHLAPDFTNLLKPHATEAVDRWANRPVLIPNERMLDQVDSATGTRYVQFMAGALSCARDRGLRPYIMLHERGDADLARRIAVQADFRSVEIMADEDPLCLKAALSVASFGFASRYHAIVSALSQGVPMVGTQWSHKYAELYRDYDASECLVDFSASDVDPERFVDLLSDERGQCDLRTRLLAAASRQRDGSQRMWNLVHTHVHGRRAGNSERRRALADAVERK
jgi:hypothetical protein